MTKQWLRFGRSLFFALCSLLPLGAVADDAYPERTVRIIVGFPPGGGNDVLARMLAERLQDYLDGTFIVENRPGANGFIAFDAVKKAEPDGYTLLIGPSSGMAVNPAIYETLPYDPLNDFEPISMIGGFPLLVSVHNNTPYHSLDDFIQDAKSNPGEVDYGSAATSFQLVTEAFAQQAGIKLHHIPYKGSAEAVQAVRSEQVPLTFADSAAVLGQIRSGDLRALAVSTPERISSLPEVPTIRELGYPEYEALLWSALYAPAGTPTEIVLTLQQAVQKAVQDPLLLDRIQPLGIEPIGSTREELRATMEKEIELFTQVVEEAGIDKL